MPNLSTLEILAIAVAAALVAIVLAWLPMRVLLGAIARGMAEPIRQLMQRQRDRRAAARTTPDRRKTPVVPPEP